MHILIHIGYPRTATTWFQKKFYPFVQNYNYISRNHIQDKLINTDLLHFSPDSVFNTNIDKDIIICEEMISGNFRAGEINKLFLKEFSERILKSCKEPEIILFIRNQFDIILSFYSLYLKVGGTYSFKKFLSHSTKSKLHKMFLFSYDYFLYDEIIEFLIKIFGRNKVNIFLYEDLMYQKENFIREFSNKFKFVIEQKAIKNESVNRKLKKSSFLMFRFLNSFTSQGISFKNYIFNVPWLYQIIKKMLPLFSEHDNKINSIRAFSSKEKNFINNYYKKSNMKIMEYYNLKNIKKYNYPL